MKLIVFVVFIFFHFQVNASKIPQQLDANDQITAARSLGYALSSRVLSNPYPLGGYHGFEFAMSNELIPWTDISRLGITTNSTGEFQVKHISFAKGLYNHIDVGMHFSLLPQDQAIESYGGQVRWTFFDFEHFPATLAVSAHASSANYENHIIAKNSSTDLLMSVYTSPLTLFLGVGLSRASVQFIGGANGITADQKTSILKNNSLHTFIGTNFEIDRTFIALQIDRYFETSYAIKLGYRL